MKWQELTAPQFAAAVKETGGVCILPMGVVEKHGEHLPLGTDYLTGDAIANRAAEIEPAIVFPSYYFGQIHEARHQPGAIAINARLMLELLENVCREIARNGLSKIILLNCHGGNSAALRLFLFEMLERRHEFLLYLADIASYGPDANDPTWKSMKQASDDHHAGEFETSVMLAAYPNLVHMEQIGGHGHPLGRQAHLDKVATSVWWYADFPDHYAGDAALATRQKGDYLLDCMVKRVAQHIGNVKRDTSTAALLDEFHRRANTPSQA